MIGGRHEFDAAYTEAWGDPDALERERYSVRRRNGRAKPKPRGAPPAPKAKRFVGAPFRVTSDAKIACACGVDNYTVSVNGGTPTLPATCWRCGASL